MQSFILQQIVGRDIRLMSRHFSHPAIVLADHPEIFETIRDYGLRRGLAEERIKRELYSVINVRDRFFHQQEEPVLTSLELDDYTYLKLGGVVKLTVELADGTELNVQLLRMEKMNFFVVDSTQPALLPVATMLTLEGKDYLSNMDETPFTFQIVGIPNRYFNFTHIQSIARIHPSPVEQAIDKGKLREQKAVTFIMHKNPMALLMHNFSMQLPCYANLSEYDNVVSANGYANVDNVTEASDSPSGTPSVLMAFVQRLEAIINYAVSANDIERQYPRLLDYCQANGFSVAVLDKLVNAFWKCKITT